MNARTPIEPEQCAQASRTLESCTAINLFFLETSSKYFDLQMDSLKKQMTGFFRVGVMPQGSGADQYQAACKQLLNDSAREVSRFVRESFTLSVAVQAEMTELMKNYTQQLNDLSQNKRAQSQNWFQQNLENPMRFFK